MLSYDTLVAVKIRSERADVVEAVFADRFGAAGGASDGAFRVPFLAPALAYIIRPTPADRDEDAH